MIFNLYPDDPDLQPDMIHIFYRWYTVFENRPKFLISIFTEFLQIQSTLDIADDGKNPLNRVFPLFAIIFTP